MEKDDIREYRGRLKKRAEGDDEEYRTVTATMKIVGGKSILVRTPKGKDVYIPRSLIHGGDDLKLSMARAKQQVTFRLFAWKAEEVGL